jgi:phosphohistidine phosphatase
MKTLSLFRHGKSSWKYATDDICRPLNRRGMQQAKIMAQDCVLDMPDLVVCSPANRAYSTALFYFQERGIPISLLRLEADIYETSSAVVLAYLETLPDRLNKVWVFGHNPSLQELAEQLFPPFSHVLSTSAYVCLQIDTTHWANLQASRTEFKVFQKPTA